MFRPRKRAGGAVELMAKIFESNIEFDILPNSSCLSQNSWGGTNLVPLIAVTTVTVVMAVVKFVPSMHTH